jgi:L-asparaginase
MDINKNEKKLKQFIKKAFRKDIQLINIIQKDSLHIDHTDRELLVQTVQKQTYDKIIIIHGTDTMTTSCEFVAKHTQNKTIVFTGAFVPYSIDPIEAVANLSLAVGFARWTQTHNTYIAMHGDVQPYQNMKKDKTNDTFIMI